MLEYIKHKTKQKTELFGLKSTFIIRKSLAASTPMLCLLQKSQLPMYNPPNAPQHPLLLSLILCPHACPLSHHSSSSPDVTATQHSLLDR